MGHHFLLDVIYERSLFSFILKAFSQIVLSSLINLTVHARFLTMTKVKNKAKASDGNELCTNLSNLSISKSKSYIFVKFAQFINMKILQQRNRQFQQLSFIMDLN